MAANIADIRAGVVPRIKDTAGKLSISPSLDCDVDRAILSAVEEYSKERPLEKALDLPGDGGAKYPVSSLTGFVDGFSEVTAVAFPWTSTDLELLWLERDAFGLQRIAAGLYLWFGSVRPTAAQRFMALYTVAHSVTAGACTIPATDDQAVMDLAAANACDMLAALFAQSVDGAIDADVTNRITKSREYRDLAKEYRAAYKTKMAAGGGQNRAADMVGTAVVTDAFFSDPDRTGYHFHGRTGYGRR